MKRQSSKRKRILLVLLLLGLALAAFFLLSGKKNKTSDNEERTVTVEKREVENSIELFGRLKARAEQEIRSPVPGIVAEVFVEVGSRVKKGQRIARLDDAEAAFELEKITYQLEQERFAGNKRRIALLEAEYALKHKALDDLNIKAYFDGTISRLDLRTGDVLKAGETYGRVIDKSSLAAEVEIAEIDIPRVKRGLPVDFSFSALPGLKARGSLDSFAAEAKVNERGLTVLNARLVIPSPPPELLPAYSFHARVDMGAPLQALVVDSSAVAWDEGKPYVERRKDGGWERVTVRTEGFGSGYVRLLEGVAEGDELKVLDWSTGSFSL